MVLLKKVLFICILFVFSCNANKLVNKETNKLDEKVAVESTDNYRFIVSFYSPGNGIDTKMKESYLDFIGNNYPIIKFEKTNWGREGEVDFCFLLDELNENDQVKFITESNNILSNSERVNVYENVPCRNRSGN